MKDVVTPVPPEELRAVIKKCLENAALVNYTRICNELNFEGELIFSTVISKLTRKFVHLYKLKNYT